jgi:hypothetical protein
MSLYQRYTRSGDDVLLAEAIRLQWETLELQPLNHADRAMACTHLANSLAACFERTADMSLLDKATQLHQEGLNLRPTGHLDRVWSCKGLAYVLMQRFRYCQDGVFLDDAIDLLREVLTLQSSDHVEHAHACVGLADALMRRLCPFDTETDPAALQEISDLLHKALILFPQGHPERWSCLVQLADLAALQRDWTTTIENLQEAVDSPAYDNIDRLLSDVFRIIDSLGIKDMCHEQRRSVLKLYRSTLGLTTLAVGVAIDTSTQLRHVYQGSTIGSCAFTLANMVGDLEAGLQLVEYTRGVIWSQALHLRHPDIGRVPHEHAKKLKDLLSSINAPLPTANFDVGERRRAFFYRT